AGSAPVELVVHPDHRQQGIGRSIASSLIADGETEFWAHGDLAGAQALAARLGLEAQRSLLVLRLTFAGPPTMPQVPAGISLRSFSTDDAESIVAVNARAFADHPEQGSMDLADFTRRMSSEWF